MSQSLNGFPFVADYDRFSIFLLTAELERGPPTEPNVVLMLKLLKLGMIGSTASFVCV